MPALPVARRLVRPGDDEPPAGVQDLPAEFGGEPLRGQVALEDPVPRAVVEHPLLPALGGHAGAQGGVDDDELRRDPPSLGQEVVALAVGEVTVEVAREDAVERAGGEGQCERVPDDREPLGHALLRTGHHGRALVEADDEPGEVPGQEARPARHVEGAARRQGGEQRDDRLHLVAPPGPVARGEATDPVVPLVVLAGTPLVVGVRRGVTGEAHPVTLPRGPTARGPPGTAAAPPP